MRMGLPTPLQTSPSSILLRTRKLQSRMHLASPALVLLQSRHLALLPKK